MEVYFYILAAILILGIFMPQEGPQRKYYIILMTVIHTFVAAFRNEHLTGDLMKYHYMYLQYDEMGWFSEELLQGGRNTGFYVLNKLVNELTGENFQILLIVIAVFTHVVLAVLIYRYSTMPWLSFLVWNCMGFYVFELNAIKQALAMAFLMLAFIGVVERRLSFYLAMMAIAVSIHMPALIFLPVYWLTAWHVDRKTILFYMLLGLGLFAFKNQFVYLVKLIYYETDEELVYSGEVGGRFVMVLGFIMLGVLFTGMSNPNFEKLFHIMAIAAILQMLSGYDHIFTRLTDFYFQFAVLYLPMTFYPAPKTRQRRAMRAVFPFNVRSLRFISVFAVVFLLWFYYKFNLNSGMPVSGISYLNFSFMWDVQ